MHGVVSVGIVLRPFPLLLEKNLSIVSRHSDKCIVKQANSSKEVTGEVMAFNEGRNLTVVINKSVKILMNWNGRVYEGRGAGMDFESAGPAITRTQTASRG